MVELTICLEAVDVHVERVSMFSACWSCKSQEEAHQAPDNADFVAIPGDSSSFPRRSSDQKQLAATYSAMSRVRCTHA